MCSLCFILPFKVFVSVLLHTFFTMSVSSGDDGSVLECAVRGPGSAVELRTGWEGWLEGACLAQLASDEDDAIHVAVLHAGRNGFLVLAEEGDFSHTGPWHRDGWVDDYSHYYYFGCLVYMDPFNKWFFNSSGFFVLIWGIRVVLFAMIRREGIVAGWMPVTGGYFVAPSCFLRFPLSRAWWASLVGLQGCLLIY
jgi:hypothetical protein